MRILTDTNLLLRLSEPAHTLHQTAVEATDRLRSWGHELVVVPQCMYEFWSVSTRTVAANGLGRTSLEAEAHVARLVRLFTLLRDERAVFEYWQQLVATYQVTGVKSHDTRIVAAMVRHELTHLLTFNDADFRKYAEVTVVVPTDVLAGHSFG